MDMNNTPETQKAVLESNGQWSFVLKECCERLERERDEARKHLEDVKEYGTDEINAAVELRQKLAQALVERDEALSQIAQAEKRAERFCQERDEARTELEMWHDGNIIHLFHRDELEKTERERDEAREAFVIATDQMVIAQGKVREANKERDEARVALMKIEDLFIDGTDIYADRENMGTIARKALEGAK